MFKKAIMISLSFFSNATFAGYGLNKWIDSLVKFNQEDEWNNEKDKCSCFRQEEVNICIGLIGCIASASVLSSQSNPITFVYCSTCLCFSCGLILDNCVKKLDRDDYFENIKIMKAINNHHLE